MTYNFYKDWPPPDRGGWSDFDRWWFRNCAAQYPNNDAVTIQVRNMARKAFEAALKLKESK